MQICGDPSDRYSQASGSSIKLLGGGSLGSGGAAQATAVALNHKWGRGWGGWDLNHKSVQARVVLFVFCAQTGTSQFGHAANLTFMCIFCTESLICHSGPVCLILVTSFVETSGLAWPDSFVRLCFYL